MNIRFTVIVRYVDEGRTNVQTDNHTNRQMDNVESQ